MRVFVTGGTGQVGKRLIPRLREAGDQVVLLTRNAVAARAVFGEGCSIVEGNPMQPGQWQDAVGECDGVLNLAGENVFGRRWNEAYKTLLRESRVRTAANVIEALGRQPRSSNGQPKVLVNASAIGYYGPRGDEDLDEQSPCGNDTLAKLCIDWEAAACNAEALGVRVVRVRIGVVLDPLGGALNKLLLPFKLGAGGPAGSGKQCMSWIHFADLVGLLQFALHNLAAVGPINGTAPHPVTNHAFGKALGRVLHRPSFMPTPGFALRLALGEVADLILSGQRVLPKKALELGYRFQFPEVEGALADLLKA